MTDDFVESLEFVIDSLKSGMLVQQQHIEAIEKFLRRQPVQPWEKFQPADTAHVGEEFREKWAHLLKEE